MGHVLRPGFLLQLHDRGERHERTGHGRAQVEQAEIAGQALVLLGHFGDDLVLVVVGRKLGDVAAGIGSGQGVRDGLGRDAQG